MKGGIMETLNYFISEEKEEVPMVKEKLTSKTKLDPDKLYDAFEKIEGINDLKDLKLKISEIKRSLGKFVLKKDSNGIKVSVEVFLKELNQLEESQTLERLKHYIKMLKKSFKNIENGKISDINLRRWKEYSHIVTDSLWNWPKRDNSGVHMAGYHGNFIPQIPHQTILRYTKKRDTVLDVFLGSGTPLIECKRLGRFGVGVEVQPKVVEAADELIEKESNKYQVRTRVICGDSRKEETKEDVRNLLEEWGLNEKVQLLIMHPPYADIIKFSDLPEDISNIPSVPKFLEEFGKVVDNTYDLLDDNRFLVLVIGDKYEGKEWIPLGFLTMQEIIKRGYMLKSIVVKNFEDTLGKRNQKQLWRLRALKGGFYIFKHEYVMIFQKIKKRSNK